MKNIESNVQGVKLTELLPFSFSAIYKGDPYFKGKIEEEFGMKFRYKVDKITKEAMIIIFQKSTFKDNNKTFELNITLETPFLITPFDKSTAALLFKCSVIAEDNLQKIINSFFAPKHILISRSSYLNAKGALDKIIDDFKTGKFLEDLN